MPNPTCAVCNAEVLAATDIATRILCARCRSASTFDALPVWPQAGHAMLPGSHQMMAGDDDEDDDGGDDEQDKGKKGKSDDDDDDDGKFSDKPSKGKPGKGEYSDKPGKGGKGKPSDDDDDDDDDDDRPRKAPPKGGMGVGLIVGIALVAVSCCICLPAGGGIAFVFMAKPAAARVTSINNAKQIALAVHNHSDANRFLPSPRSDKAELSWRVAILPYIEQVPLYQQFDQNAGWDKGRNQALVNSRPMTYDCPMHPPELKTQTSWQYFTGPRTPFPEHTTKVKITDFLDGTSNTFLFADGANPVPWSKPTDIPLPPAGPIAGLRQGAFIVAMADGSVRLVDHGKVDDNAMRIFIDPRDGQVPPFNLLD